MELVIAELRPPIPRPGLRPYTHTARLTDVSDGAAAIVPLDGNSANDPSLLPVIRTVLETEIDRLRAQSR